MSSPSSVSNSNQSYVGSFFNRALGVATNSPEEFVKFRGKTFSYLPTKATNALSSFQNSSFLKKLDAYGLNNQNLVFVASVVTGLTLACKYPEWTIVPAATVLTFVPTSQALKATALFTAVAFSAACVVNSLAANDIYEP